MPPQENPLSPITLAGLPAGWVAQLQEATRRGLATPILDLAEQIKSDRSDLAQTLARWAKE
jgi:hypothetical protein